MYVRNHDKGKVVCYRGREIHTACSSNHLQETSMYDSRTRTRHCRWPRSAPPAPPRRRRGLCWSLQYFPPKRRDLYVCMYVCMYVCRCIYIYIYVEAAIVSGTSKIPQDDTVMRLAYTNKGFQLPEVSNTSAERAKAIGSFVQGY